MLHLINALLEGCLLGVNLVSAEIPHPGVVADQLFLSPLASCIVESLELLSRLWCTLTDACPNGIRKRKVLDAPSVDLLTVNEGDVVCLWADRHSNLVTMLDNIEAVILLSNILDLGKAFLEVWILDFCMVDLLSGLDCLVGSKICTPTPCPVKSTRIERGIVLLEQANGGFRLRRIL